MLSVPGACSTDLMQTPAECPYDSILHSDLIQPFVK